MKTDSSNILKVFVEDTVHVGVIRRVVRAVKEFVETVAKVIFTKLNLTINLFSLPPTSKFNSLVTQATF